MAPPARLARCLGVALAVALAYAAATYLGRAARPEDSQVALAWPAAGVGVSLLLLLRRAAARRAALAGLVLASFAVNAATGLPLLAAAVFALVNGGHAALGHHLVVRFVPDRALRSPRDLTGLLLASALTGLVSGTASAVTATSLLDEPLGEGLLLFVVRNGGTMLAVTAVACALLARGRPRWPGTRPAAEAAGIGAVGVGLYVLLFVLPVDLPLLFLAVAVSVWAGSRVGVATTAVLGLLWSSLAVASAVAGYGVLGAVADVQVRAVLVQSLVVVVTVVGLSLATGRATTLALTAELARSLEQLRQATDAAVIGKAVVVRGPDGGWSLTRPNPALVRLLRRDPSAVRWRELLHPDDSLRLRAVLDRLADDGLETAEVEVRHRVPGQGLLWTQVHLSLLPDSDGGTSVVAQVVDVHEQRAARERLSRLALHDPLTGLSNRVHLTEEVDRLLADPRVPGVAVLFLDLDRFKAVNDGYGHETGDRVLQQVADTLRATLRPDDVVCRLGGDEFVACCPGVTTAEDATAVVGRLERALRTSLLVDGRDLGLAVSTGVALSGAGDDAASLVRRADRLMYEVKRSHSALPR
ncbi:diguanylate cyclase domain-containing protein [Aquipuribacter sp. SD81]|uniref:diguanylate cyclase domain-containing protein n=1 Tax=Aquipuribacter sp. SD81 TaxID=3127703 RepID=UPI003015F300